MKTTTWKISTLTLLIPALTTLAFADNLNTNAPNPPAQNLSQRMWDLLTAQEFVTDAAIGGMKEMYLSDLALTNSQNQEVRNIAHRMIRDHSRANAQLARVAQQKGLVFPATNTFAANDPNWNNPLITGDQQLKGAELTPTNSLRIAYQGIKQMQSLTGKQFDEAYAQDLVMDHAYAIAEYEAAERIVPDPDLKNFARHTLPILRTHLQMAQELAARIANAPSASLQETNRNLNTASTTAPGETGQR